MVCNRLLFCAKVGHISLMFGLAMLQVSEVLFHQTDLFSISLAFFHLDLLFEIINILFVELSLLDLVESIFYALKTLFQLLENLVREHLVLWVLRILLELLFWLLELLLHHFNLGIQLTYVLDMLCLSFLHQQLFGTNFIPKVRQLILNLMQFCRLLLYLHLMTLLFLSDFNIIKFFLIFTLFLNIFDLSLKLIELYLEGVPFSLLTHLLWTYELQLVSTRLYQTLKTGILPLLLLKDHRLLLEVWLEHEVDIYEKGVDLV